MPLLQIIIFVPYFFIFAQPFITEKLFWPPVCLFTFYE